MVFGKIFSVSWQNNVKFWNAPSDQDWKFSERRRNWWHVQLPLCFEVAVPNVHGTADTLPSLTNSAQLPTPPHPQNDPNSRITKKKKNSRKYQKFH